MKIVDSARPDAVSADVDHPGEIDTWMNAACVRAGVPFCRAGMSVTEGIVWSVDPGRSACLACNDGDRADASPGARQRTMPADLHASAVPRVNRASARSRRTSAAWRPSSSPVS